MSEFKFACPVCGQHMMCDVSQGGSVMECPTCFQKIVAPQAAAADGNLILTGTVLSEKKISVPGAEAPAPPKKKFPAATVLFVLALIGAVGAAAYFYQEKTSGLRPAPAQNEAAPARQATQYGAIGLATWHTTAEFRNIAVTRGGETLYQSDFSAGTTGWRFTGGTWITRENALVQTDINNQGGSAVTGDPAWTNYTLTLQARKLAGSEGFLILFNVADDQNLTWLNLGGWNNTQNAIEITDHGVRSVYVRMSQPQIQTGHWYDIRIETQEKHVRCRLDDQLVAEFNYP